VFAEGNYPQVVNIIYARNVTRIWLFQKINLIILRIQDFIISLIERWIFKSFLIWKTLPPWVCFNWQLFTMLA